VSSSVVSPFHNDTPEYIMLLFELAQTQDIPCHFVQRSPPPA
jgi:hypothetical protein